MTNNNCDICGFFPRQFAKFTNAKKHFRRLRKPERQKTALVGVLAYGRVQFQKGNMSQKAFPVLTVAEFIDSLNIFQQYEIHYGGTYYIQQEPHRAVYRAVLHKID